MLGRPEKFISYIVAQTGLAELIAGDFQYFRRTVRCLAIDFTTADAKTCAFNRNPAIKPARMMQPTNGYGKYYELHFTQK